MDEDKKNILIIEDEQSIAELERDYLEISGFSVDIASDGDTGLQKALEGDYALIILDLMLPGKDGFQVCKEVREVKDIPIIIVSARKDDIDKIRGLGLGADDYVTKPFSASEMVARVKAHMARYARLVGGTREESGILEIHGLKIDPDARRVFVNGEERTFTTKELFKEIWKMDSVGDIATVTVHIKKIREKIEMDSAKPQYIETIWGVGYRFKV